MKKSLLMTIALVCAGVQGAWAQEATTFGGGDGSSENFSLTEDISVTIQDQTFYLPANFEGEGTEASPYLIKTTDDLDRLSHRVNDLISDCKGEYYKVEEDLTYAYDENTKTNYTPIGNQYVYDFCGTFDGNNKTISGIRIDLREETDEKKTYYKGLFGIIGEGATVKNVILGNSIIYANYCVGGIAGEMDGGTIENCHVLGSVELIGTGEDISHFGGIVGEVFDYNTIKGCTSAAKILNVDSYAGGIVGYSNDLLTVEDCLFYGPAPEGQDHIGLVVGGLDDSDEATLSQYFQHNYCTMKYGDESYYDVDHFEKRNFGYVLDDVGDNSYSLGMLANLPEAAGPYDITLVYRTLYRDGSWNTLCLPFALTAEQISNSDLKGADIRTLTGSSFDKSTGTLTLDFSTSSLTSIEAGKPYLVRWKETEYEGEEELEDPNFYNIKVDGTAASPIETDWVNFVGSYSREILSDGDKSVLYLGDENTLYYPAEDVKIRACRAVFQLKGLTAGELNAQAPFRLNFGDEETGIREITTPSNLLNPWFTLDGRRLDAQPTAKGIYLTNGKKVVIK